MIPTASSQGLALQDNSTRPVVFDTIQGMSDASAIPTRIPEEFHQFFWDVDADKVNPKEYSTYVIHRILDKGNLNAARWLLRNFPKEDIIKTLKTVRDFTPRNAVFWTQYFNISREETRCLHPHYLKQRRMLWPY